VKDLTLQSSREPKEARFFKSDEAQQIIAVAKEPYRTIFIGLRWNFWYVQFAGLALSDADGREWSAIGLAHIEDVHGTEAEETGKFAIDISVFSLTLSSEGDFHKVATGAFGFIQHLVGFVHQGAELP